MSAGPEVSLSGVNRRRFMQGATAATVLGTTGAVGLAAAAPAGATQPVFPRTAAPKPIVAVVDTAPPGGPPSPPPFDLIHWLLPGPDGAQTQILELPAFGLDADPSTITDFDGFVAYAVVAGKARDANNNSYDVEFDVRVMKGQYIGEDGKRHHGTFGFF